MLKLLRLRQQSCCQLPQLSSRWQVHRRSGPIAFDLASRSKNNRSAIGLHEDHGCELVVVKRARLRPRVFPVMRSSC